MNATGPMMDCTPQRTSAATIVPTGSIVAFSSACGLRRHVKLSSCTPLTPFVVATMLTYRLKDPNLRGAYKKPTVCHNPCNEYIEDKPTGRPLALRAESLDVGQRQLSGQADLNWRLDEPKLVRGRP